MENQRQWVEEIEYEAIDEEGCPLSSRSEGSGPPDLPDQYYEQWRDEGVPATRPDADLQGTDQRPHDQKTGQR